MKRIRFKTRNAGGYGCSWQADHYFDSQGSFFKKDGKPFARCTIRRWTAIPE